MSTPRSTGRRRALRASLVALVTIATVLVGASTATAGSVTGVTFTPDSHVADNEAAVWTVGFTPTHPISIGNAVVVSFPTGFDVSGADAEFASGIGTDCYSPAVSVFGQRVIVPLDGFICALGASMPATLTITGISAPPGEYVTGEYGEFRVATYRFYNTCCVLDGDVGYPPAGGIDMRAALTYSTLTSAGTPTTGGTAPLDPGSPFSTTSNATTIAANPGGLTLTGHTFAGWCTTNAAAAPTQCTGTQYAPTDAYVVAANTTLYSVWTDTTAADGTGTITTPTSSAIAGSAGNTIAFTYEAAAGGMSGGAVHVEVPTGWSAPSAAAGPGCTTASTGTLSFAGRVIQLTGLTLAEGAVATITFGATSGGSCTAGSGAVAPGSLGSGTFTTTQTSTAGGTLTALAASPEVSVDPPTCAPGTYLSVASCLQADPGYFVDMSGATSQTPCPAGAYAMNAGSAACIPASPGRYVDVTASTTDLPCPLGTFTPNSGSTECTAAPPGHYVDMAGAANPTRCAAGTSSSALAATDASTCTPAPAGRFVPAAGATGSMPCAVGTFSAAIGAAACTPAPPGSFVSATGATRAEPCAADQFSSQAQSTSCLPCPSGTSTRGATGSTECRTARLVAGRLTFNWVAEPGSYVLQREGTWSDLSSGVERFTITMEHVAVPQNGNCASASWADRARVDTGSWAGFPRILPARGGVPTSPRCVRFVLTMYDAYGEQLTTISDAQNSANASKARAVSLTIAGAFSEPTNSFRSQFVLDVANALGVSASRFTILNVAAGSLGRASARPPAQMFQLTSKRLRSGKLQVRLNLTKAGRAYLNKHPRLKGTRQRVTATFVVRLKGSRTPVRVTQTFRMRMPK